MARGDVEADRTGRRMEDGFAKTDALYAQARTAFTDKINGGNDEEPPVDFLQLLRDARPRLQQYYQENLQAPIDTSYRAFRNRHFQGSKYWHEDYRNRSKLYRPKTRTAVRKSDAAAVSALFSTSDAVKFSAGDESDPMQQANAALQQELFNYRTDRSSGMAAMPWFRIAAGAHQDAMITSACVSKQYWRLELRHVGQEPVQEPQLDEAGSPVLDETGQAVMQDVLGEDGEPMMNDVYEEFIDRPDVMLFPLENIEIDPAAHWLNPIQSASVFIAKVPMTIDEVIGMQQHPLNPWKELSEEQLRSYASTSDQTARSTRQSREGGQDRLDSRYTGTRSFEIVWVYEVFIRYRGKDTTFWCAQDKAYLTDPKPVHEVYPEQGGERPYTFGVINLESHRLFPMSPVESWQPMQIEINDFANLILDTAKLNVAPVTKVVAGKNVDLRALSRRGPNSQIMVQAPEDVTWDKPPGISAEAFNIVSGLNVDFDDQAGQFNSGSVQTNRSLNETVGGMRLIAGSANAVSEFDQRVWIETWVEPTIAQVAKLIQYYEKDETILALCGKRAQLFQKFGVNEITDHLLQQQLTVKVDAGVGNADPMERLAKMGQVLGVLLPLFEGNQKVASGEIVIDEVELAHEALGLGGWRDGDRFIRKGQPQQQQGAMMDPTLIAKAKDLEASAELKKVQQIKVLAEAKKIGAEEQKVKVDTVATVHGVAADQHDRAHGRQMDERGHQLTEQDQQHRHGLEQNDQQHRHGIEKVGVARELMGDHRTNEQQRGEAAHRDREFEDTRTHRDREFADTTAHRDKQFETEQQRADREFKASREDAKAADTREKMKLKVAAKAKAKPKPKAKK